MGRFSKLIGLESEKSVEQVSTPKQKFDSSFKASKETKSTFSTPSLKTKKSTK